MTGPGDPLQGFEKLSPAKQKLLLRRLEERRKREETIPRSPRREGDGRFPLSFAQRRLWFLAHLEPGQPAYHLPYALRLRGPLDPPALADAFAGAVRRHEALRTVFELSEGEPWQRVLPPAPLPLPLVDLSVLSPAERSAETLRLGAEEALHPFDVDRGPHLRATLLRLEPEEHVLLFTLHHLVSDAWSMGVLVREIGAFTAGRSDSLPELPVQYPDYADWQREQLAGAELERLLAWWREELAGLPGSLDLPADRPRPALASGRGAHIHGILPRERTEALGVLREREGSTLFMILLAAFSVLLRRLTGEEDLAVGTPVANRPRQELEPLIGFFVNTLVLRVRPQNEDPTFRELLARVKETTLGAYAHQDLPFQKLVEELRPARDLSRTPLFQVMLSLQNAWERAAPELPGLTVEPLDQASPTAKFDLSLLSAESAGGLALTIEYATDLFDTSTAWRFFGHFTTLLGAIAADPDRRISDLPLWTEIERHQVLIEWNDAREDHAEGPQTLHELVALQARRTPDAPALIAGAESLTYADLDRRAEELAARLRARGAGPERIVAVRLPRTAELVIALLGVLKSGAAYLPLDPAYPEERVRFMVEDSGAAVVLEEKDFKDSKDLKATRSLQSLESFGSLNTLAYLIYTSGSTGRPKGVAIEHRSAVALVRWARTVFSPGELAGVLASTSVSFDLSIFEIFVPLALGGRVILVEDALRLRELPAEAGVTLVNTVPSALDALLRTGGLPASVRTVNLAGEPIPRDLVERVRRLPGIRLLNLYGPSEDTTYSTWAEIRESDRPAPIGRPVSGTHVHLIDARLQPVPVGAPGHLHLGGRGLARGYFRRPDLTADRFVPDPFYKVDGWSPGDRLYRTGDLARRRPDGVLEFLGRIDQQVKVRGFRIEPGEIEAALTRHPGVREAAVGVWTSPSGDRRLVAWVAGDVPAAELRAWLGETLPAPIIPSAFVTLEALPRTANGKLDRKALPPPEAPAEAQGTAPATEMERAVAAIWRDVLGIERVGSRDNFFDLGGHSLLLVRVHDRLQRDLGADLPLVDLFRYPDVASLARRLRSEAPEAAVAAPAAAPRTTSRDIAVIGMAGRFPGAPDLAAFWRNLREGVESITFFRREEMLAAGVPATQLEDPAHVPARGHLDGIDQFDAAFFDLSPREAAYTDPQHRLFLECAAEALESAGQDPARQGLRAGVWAGMAFSTYAVVNLLSHAGRPGAPGGLELMAGNDKDYLATRVSYKLDLRGPAMTVQTACSSSLVAVHLACRSLLEGECEIALAGGASVHLPQKSGYFWQEGGILSPDGHCRSFDAEARGTVGGDGVGVVVLKPLPAALADGDPIHAVIRGSALANDGAGKVGFTAPSVEGQARAIAQAQAAAGVEPSSIGMIEAHGSATPLGDPIEMAALSQVFGAGAGPRTCAVGSVKSNIGHLDAAAGIAGLLKAVLAVKHGEIPPSLHFRTPNPQIDFASGPFYVSTGLHPWPEGRGPRRAGVSSFGLGGTNAHVVLEEAPAREPDAAPARPGQLLVLSARSATALETATDRLAAHLQENPDLPLASLADIAWTLQAGRRPREHRRALVVRSGEDAVRTLSLRDPRRLLTGECRGGERPVAFVFPGLGEQYGGMGSSLYREEPVFRDAIDRCAGLLGPRLGRDLRELLGFDRAAAEGAGGAAPEGPDLRRMLRRGTPAERADKELTRTAVAQPAVFTLEYALAELWLSWGVQPQAVIGYSLGEYVAACVAGVLSLEDALTLVAERARWIEDLPAGSMLAVGLPPEEIDPLLGEALSLAAVNGPRLCVVAGPPAAVADLETRLAARGDAFRPVETTHAFHSQMMLPVAPRLTELVRTIERRPPRIPCLSNVTGGWLTATDALDPDYWSRHLCGPVRFAAGVAELWKEPDRVLVEVGPGGSLTSMALQHLVTVDPEGAGDRIAVRSLPSLHEHRPDRSDRAYLLQSLAKLWLAGVEPSWPGLHAGERRRRVELPAYPFERQRFWVEPVSSSPVVAGAEAEGAKERRGLHRTRLRQRRPEGTRRVRRPLAMALAEAIGEPGAPITPISGHARPNLRNAYVVPEGELEQTLAGLWQRLLGIAAVGRHDSFFEMGGHSLLATQLMADVRTRFGVSLPMASLFENPTVAELAALVARRRREGDLGIPAGAALPEVVPDPERRFEPFPLTDIQQAYWLGRSAAFEMGNIGSYIYQETDFTGLDLGRLEQALRRAVDRHDMLHAVILPDGRQQVLPEVPPYQIPVLDLTGVPAAAREEALLAVRNEMSHQVFDVGRWPLFDLRAARLEEDRLRLFFGIDVLIGDGWSFTLLFRDLARFYLDPEAELEPLEISFRDYVVAEAAVHETEGWRRSLEYWQERLATLPGAPELPLAKSPAALEQPRFRRRTAGLDAASWKRLKERGSRAGLTPSGLLLAAFSEILTAWSGNPRFTLTLTLFNRPPVHPQIHDLVGDFTSLTLLGVDMSLAGDFETRARAVQERLWQDLEHRAVSGVRVLRELARIQGRQVALPVIFTSALGLQPDAAGDEAFAGPADVFPEETGIRSEPVWGVSQTPQVWIDHQAGEHGGALSFNWDVVEELFPPGMIDAMWGAWRELLRRLAEDDAAWTAERRRLIPTQQIARRVLANSTGAPVSHDRLHGLFAAQALSHPDRPAVLAPERTLTYGELFRLSNRLGRHLRELGAKPNTLVAVVQEKGWEQVVSVLGVLASGAAYLPVEPGLPRERFRAILERGEATLAVTTPDVDAALDWPEGLRRVVLTGDGSGLPEDDTPLDPAQRNTDLAYVIFTSGSTGTPKGVMIDHRGAVNTILDVNRTWNVGPDDRVLALSSLSFDLSVWDLFGMLAAGGAVVLPRAGAWREPLHWLERLRGESVTVWNTVPALLRMLVDILETAPPGSFESPLRLALLSGDWIPLDLPGRVRALSPRTRLVSLGGATEASIWSITHPIDRVDPSWKSIPYGRPMANQTFHVLDGRLEPSPDWVPGHLYIGGLGLAKGYWRDAEKTAASFVTHPDTGERLYRTGDLGRALPDGTIEILGREDFQVKIQGYRIELGEIETALAGHPAVRAAVAAAAGDRMGTRRLVAYVVPNGPWDGLAETLREHLRSKLPEYMVPAVLIPLDALPLGSTGKVDRRLLPEPDSVLAQGEHRPPATETETALAGIWSEVLRKPLERIGRGAGFFELGGDSLLATQIMARVREVFGIELPLRIFFEAATLEAQAEAIDRERPRGDSDEEKLARLLEQLQDASADEVERMLAELRGAG